MLQRDWIGSVLVIIGCSLATAFGNHQAKSFTASQILCLYGQPIFLIVASVLAVLAVPALLSLHKVVASSPMAQLISGAYIPAFLCGIQTISFKSMSEITANASFGEGNEWGTWRAWLFVSLVVTISIVQLRYMNFGAEFQASKYFPAYNAMLMAVVIIMVAVFSQSLTPFIQ